MRVSFYRNLTWLIGILVAIEIVLKIGYQRGLLMLVADLAVVLLLTFLFHRMRIGGYDQTAERLAADESANDQKAETEWQKKHDQWWQAHRQLRTGVTQPAEASRSQSTAQQADNSSRPATPGSTVDLSQLERTNHQLKAQIDGLNRKISVLRNGQIKSKSYRDADWYRQIVKMRKQIAKLKSEYK